MTGSGYDSHPAVVPCRAAGYSPMPNGLLTAPFLHLSIPHGAGAPTGDLHRWSQALFAGGLLSAASLPKDLNSGVQRQRHIAGS